eukprot:TRINITY_DN2313_c0_g1_i1.p1 TRINITY_DN2313_c0_g1~~TRINITY_DN2313_c0_g1_i1.p1  ORF type:complete len:134 (-),score=23.64 TRINITY_DN2313_c0_g1_i1:176-523(-)
MSINAATFASKTLKEALTNGRKLYRAWSRSIPAIRKQYDIDEVSVPEARARLREEFAKHAAVKDAAVIDMLCFKGSQELQETQQLWKQKLHLMEYFETNKPKASDFLTRFYAGNA